MMRVLKRVGEPERDDAAWAWANAIAAEDIATNEAIGKHGLTLIEAAHKAHNRPINILTHCNAGALACVDWGTATAPIYMAHDAGIPVHVWVEETRPRNQGLLTAWELREHGVPHTYIVDNAGGHFIQRGQVDMVMVGADRVSRGGDVANKIGTYQKALAAFDNDVPFYAALPSSTIDWQLENIFETPIEERSSDEIRSQRGQSSDGLTRDFRLLDEASPVANPGFDVTPARLVTAIITESGIAAPANLAALFKKT
jgi:methylthioribose-1-phosphate isomerase